MPALFCPTHGRILHPRHESHSSMAVCPECARDLLSEADIEVENLVEVIEQGASELDLSAVELAERVLAVLRAKGVPQ